MRHQRYPADILLELRESLRVNQAQARLIQFRIDQLTGEHARADEYGRRSRPLVTFKGHAVVHVVDCSDCTHGLWIDLDGVNLAHEIVEAAQAGLVDGDAGSYPLGYVSVTVEMGA